LVCVEIIISQVQKMPKFTPREEGGKKNIEPHVLFGNFSIKPIPCLAIKNLKKHLVLAISKRYCQEKSHWSEILTPRSTN
jgi:hypothetical protein